MGGNREPLEGLRQQHIGHRPPGQEGRWLPKASLWCTSTGPRPGCNGGAVSDGKATRGNCSLFNVQLSFSDAPSARLNTEEPMTNEY